MPTERRYTPLPVEFRAGDGSPLIQGYAAMFGKRSKNLGGYVEQIDNSFFNRSASRAWPDVVARFNHDDNMLLGSTGAGTLRLHIDDQGLRYEVQPPKSRSDIVELVERGDVRYSSFAFYTIEDEWDTTDESYPRRTLVSGDLVDVAPVVNPAYADTSAGLSSFARKFEVEVEEVRKYAEADELRKFFTRTDGPSLVVPKATEWGAKARMDILSRKDPAE